MKRNSKLFIVVLLIGIFSIGISFAYFLVGITYGDEGNRNIGGTPVRNMLNVSYDSDKTDVGTGIINPGDSDSVNFSVDVTPFEITDIAYVIKLNISNNTFEKCTESNKNNFSNNCLLNADEFKYTLKDTDNNKIIATGTLEGVVGEKVLVTQAKTVAMTTEYNYELTLEFVETGYDQNHNANKAFSAEVVVEFADLPNAVDMILANKVIADRGTIETIFTENTTGKIYKAQDDDGDSYYFAGAVDNNYVSFANKTWRIVRINGDGSIRLILNSGFEDREKYGTKFNASTNDNKYVGFKYSDNNVSGTDNPSSVYSHLMTWYYNNLRDYEDYIDKEAGFCGDRSISEIYGGTGLGTSVTYYGAYDRLREKNTEKIPTLICEKDADLYTTSGTSKGNGSLDYPIGLITADELTLAGALHNVVNESYYLYSPNTWWTMTPYRFANGSAHVYYITLGKLTTVDHVSEYTWYLVRPVINLRADTIFNYDGEGTSSNPYTVKGAI